MLDVWKKFKLLEIPACFSSLNIRSVTHVGGSTMILCHRFVVPSPRFVKESIGSQNTTTWYRRDLAAYSGVRSPSSHFLVFLTFFFLVNAAISFSSSSLVSSPSILLLLIFLLFAPLFSYFSRCTSSWDNRLKVSFTPSVIIKILHLRNMMTLVTFVISHGILYYGLRRVNVEFDSTSSARLCCN